MAGEIAYKLTAGEKQAVDAIGKLVKALADAEGGTKKISDETRKLQKEQEEMGRMAQRVLADIQTPLEKYAKKMADLQTLVENGKLSQDDYARATKQAGDELEKAGQKGEKAFGPEAVGMAKEFLGALGFAGGIAEGVKLIKEQWEQVEAVEKRVLQASLTTADAQRKFREAAGFGTIAETHQAEENLERMSTQTGVAGKDLYLTAASAMGDRRGLSRARTMEAVQEAAAEFPADAAAREEFSKQLVGVMGATKMGAKEAGGWLLSTSEQMGVKLPDMASIINAAPGEDPGRLAAMAQGIGGAFGIDPTRAVMQISTALGKAIQQAAQPDQKEVARKTKDISDQVFKGLIPQAEGAQRIEELSKPRFDVSEAGTTLSDQLAWARQHGDLLDLDAMAKDLHLKGPAPKIALGEFLQGEGKAWELEEQSFAGQRRGAAAIAYATERGQKIQEGALQATARRHRQAEAVKHHFEVTPGGQIQAEMADLREDLAQGLAFAGESPLFSKLGEAGAMMYGKGDPESIGYWRSRRRSAENYVETIRHPGATEQEQNQAQYLQTLINRMDSLILEMQKNTQATERQKPSDEPMPPSRQNMNPTLANRRHHDD